MVFPVTPLGERKLIALQNKINDSNNNDLNLIFKSNPKKSARRVNMATDEKNKPTHRSYETIDELRVRLMKNYKEAKKQREKYLNINKAKTNPDSCINGYRSKPNQQPVFKNYKMKLGEDGNRLKPRGHNGGTSVTFADTEQPSSSNCKNSISFAEELSDAIQKQSDVIAPVLENSTSYSTPVANDDSSDSVKMVTNNASATIDDNVKSAQIKTTPSTTTTASSTPMTSQSPITSPTVTKQTSRIVDSVIPLRSISFTPPEVESRIILTPSPTKSSMKNILKRSDSSSKNDKSVKRKTSIKKKSVDRTEVTQEDVESVLTNQHSRDSLFQVAAILYLSSLPLLRYSIVTLSYCSKPSNICCFKTIYIISCYNKVNNQSLNKTQFFFKLRHVVDSAEAFWDFRFSVGSLYMYIAYLVKSTKMKILSCLCLHIKT